MTNAKRLLFFGDDSPQYINLLTAGGCESTAGWNASNSYAIAANADNKYEGTNCIKITSSATVSGAVYRSALSLIQADKYYLVSAYVKNVDMPTGIRIGCYVAGDGGTTNTAYVTDTNYTRLGFLLSPTQLDTATTFNVEANAGGAGTPGKIAYFDAFMINEISASDHALGVAVCLTKYPYKAP